jgi:electron transfer flavoprotein beta subunit
MANMKTIMPALQKAQAAAVGAQGLSFVSVELPKQERQTRIVKDSSVDDMAKEIVTWIKS